MPSPFPGMNPYLEQEDAWQDFHGNFLERAREALNSQLLPHYFVRTNEHASVHHGVEEFGVRFLEIRDRRNREIVTVIELLSPCYKGRGPNRDKYETKRSQWLMSSAHFVEIDLLRGGLRRPMHEIPASDFYALVNRVQGAAMAEVWPFGLRHRMPKIPIPLRTGEPPVPLDLQEMLHRAYDAGGYVYYIYEGQPVPALPPEDAAWARQFLPKSSD